nr:hypothetical protein RVX_2798 [Nitratidesulfovibrio sp. HK-II]
MKRTRARHAGQRNRRRNQGSAFRGQQARNARLPGRSDNERRPREGGVPSTPCRA